MYSHCKMDFKGFEHLGSVKSILLLFADDRTSKILDATRILTRIKED